MAGDGDLELCARVGAVGAVGLALLTLGCAHGASARVVAVEDARATRIDDVLYLRRGYNVIYREGRDEIYGVRIGVDGRAGQPRALSDGQLGASRRRLGMFSAHEDGLAFTFLSPRWRAIGEPIVMDVDGGTSLVQTRYDRDSGTWWALWIESEPMVEYNELPIPGVEPAREPMPSGKLRVHRLYAGEIPGLSSLQLIEGYLASSQHFSNVVSDGEGGYAVVGAGGAIELIGFTPGHEGELLYLERPGDLSNVELAAGAGGHGIVYSLRDRGQNGVIAFVFVRDKQAVLEATLEQRARPSPTSAAPSTRARSTSRCSRRSRACVFATGG